MRISILSSCDDECRLRIVFDGAVVSAPLAAETTYGDIARLIAEAAERAGAEPLEVDLTMRTSCPASRPSLPH